jgi:parallel beta-helix repeat protein
VGELRVLIRAAPLALGHHPTTSHPKEFHMDRARLSAALGLLALAAATALAGPLAPPAGPVVSTMKTIQQMEPRTAIGPDTTPGNATATFVITQPGSYYLTGDVQGVAGKNGIEIAAENVTLDLNGFTLRGVAGSGSGIFHTTQSQMVFIADGFIEGWGGRGVQLSQGIAIATNRVERVSVRNCGLVGIQVLGSVSGCTAQSNGGGGFDVSGGGTVLDCVAINNTGIGFYLSGRFIAERCISSGNGAQGFIAANAPCQIRSCTAQANGDDGIYVAASGCIIEGNTCRANGTAVAAGVKVDGSSCFILRNTARTNNQNFVFGGVGNTYGPVITATGQISTTNPWANFGN